MDQIANSSNGKRFLQLEEETVDTLIMVITYHIMIIDDIFIINILLYFNEVRLTMIHKQQLNFTITIFISHIHVT